jgi:hypothetical protein
MTQRNPMQVGMIYQVAELGAGHKAQRIVEGDLILCLEHTGDCHYTWALLAERTRNDWTVYFDVEKIYQAYSLFGYPILEEPFTIERLLGGVLAGKVASRSAFLVRMTEEQIKEGLTRPCPTCGEPRVQYPVGKKNDVEGQAIVIL